MLRRRVLSRHGGTFELSHRTAKATPGSGWVLGLGRYSGDNLEWFRIFSLSPWPKHVWGRSRMSYDGRRDADEGERHVLYPGHVVIACTTPDGAVELALSAQSLTGFQAWLESHRPGRTGRADLHPPSPPATRSRRRSSSTACCSPAWSRGCRTCVAGWT